MADNIVKKLIRLVLDPDSKREVDEGLKDSAHKADTVFDEVGKKIKKYLTAAFAVEAVIEFTRKVIDLGKEAVKASAQSQATWNALRGTINATGASFDAMSEKLRAASEAFSDATVHDDDEYAESLTRLITLTGDVGASTNNMGLVAKVAAQFFKGDLAPATELVAKVMNGNVAVLGRMGIQATNAQEALELLAHRSMHAVEEENATFEGTLKNVHKAWEDVLKAAGEAVTANDNVTGGLNVLTAVFKSTIEWINENKTQLRDWVTNGVRFAIDALDVLLRTGYGLVELFMGGFQTSLGVAAQGLGTVVSVVDKALSAWIALQLAIGVPLDPKLLERSIALHKQADAINAWADAAVAAGSEKVQKGLNAFTKNWFTSDSVLGSGNARTAHGALDDNAPQASTAGKIAGILSASADAVGNPEQVKRLDALADAFDNGTIKVRDMIDAFTDLKAVGLASQDFSLSVGQALDQLKGSFAPFQQMLNATNRQLGEELESAALQGADGLDLLRIRQRALAQQIDAAVKLKVSKEDPAYKKLLADYAANSAAIQHQTDAMLIQTTAADFLADALGVALQGGIHEAAAQKARQTGIEALEWLVRAGAYALFGNPAGAAAAVKTAASFAAVSAAWGALAVATPKTGQAADAGGAVPSSAPAFTSDASSTRDTQARSASSTTAPSADVSIYLVGEGFDMLNPQVQRVVYGAYQQAQERYGDTARVRVRPQGTTA